MPLDPSETKVVRGVTLRRDPAREDCFVIAHHETEVKAERKYDSLFGVRSMLHREYNNEVQNAEIAAQMLVDFPDAPWELRLALARQCWDETRHARMFLRRCIELGGRKGESPIKNGDWSIVGMIESLAGRLLIQHRLFEGGVLDSFRQVGNGYKESGDDRTAEIYDVILADEVAHVRFANHWLREFAKQPRAVMQMANALTWLTNVFKAMQPKAGDRSVDGIELAEVDHAIAINLADRERAGFTQEELADLIMRDSH